MWSGKLCVFTSRSFVHKLPARFSGFREMLRMDKLCRKVGFDDEQFGTLIGGKLSVPKCTGRDSGSRTQTGISYSAFG